MAAISVQRAMQKPTTTYDPYWIWQDAPLSCKSRGETLGKWMIFQHKSQIDETWEKVRQLVESGEMGATGAKVSTMRENPNARNPDVKVICVYTTEEDVDEVGLKLIQVARCTIRYKKDETTLAGIYSGPGKDKVTCRTLEWNKGNPRFK